MDKAVKQQIERAAAQLVDVAYSLQGLHEMREDDEVKSELKAQLEQLQNVGFTLRALVEQLK